VATTILGQFFYLYLFIDIFSRKIVGWQIFTEENSEHASALMLDICRRENISPNQLTLHSDNGSPMKGATMLATLQQLGVAPSRSRPILKKRKMVYQMAKLVNPFRWSGDTRNWNWIPKVSLNPDKFTSRKSA
jgi:hypothetical protein